MSKVKNILIRADSSSEIGIGHIMRDLVLAKQYPEADITFATLDLKGNSNHKIIEAGYKIELLQSNKKKELKKLIQKLQIDLLIIDHYEIDYETEKYLKEKTGVKIFALDDTYEKHHCDILLNHNLGANKKRYRDLLPHACELRCGSDYTLLRDEFYKEKKRAYKINNSITTFFVSMGGTDYANINEKILKLLSQLHNIRVDLVTTSSNRHLQKLKQYTKNKTWIKLHINSNNIAKLMHKSDFGIITPSVTANEAYFMSLPFMAIQTAGNQKNVYKYLKKKNHPVLKKFTSKKFLTQLQKLMGNIELVNYTDLKLKEKKMILSWRNHPHVQRWMFNNDDISLENHLRFIELLEKSNDIYFVVKINKKYVGAINFTNIHNKEAALGLFVNPELHGAGKTLLQAICDYGFRTLQCNKLIAEVFADNARAIALYKKFKFKEYAKKTINNREVICMELKNENR